MTFKPLTKYTLAELGPSATSDRMSFGHMAAVVSDDWTQYDFMMYPFNDGDAWFLVAVDGEMPTASEE